MSAGDFYFAINATFRFIHDAYGKDALVDYWTALGREYHAGLAARFRSGGLAEVRRYWADYFAHEPGGDVAVSLTPRGVELDVRACPAIRWLKGAGRQLAPDYCAHCDHISTAIAAQAGLSFSLAGGGGACRQLFATHRGAA